MAREYRRERIVEPGPDDVTTVYEPAAYEPVAPEPVVEREVTVQRPAYVERRTRIEPAPVVERAYAAPAAVEPVEYVTVGHQINRVIWYFFGLLEGILALRFALRAIGANPASGFAQFIYGLTAPFVAPFHGLIAEPTFDRAALEVTTLIAMFVYLLVGIAITALINILYSRTVD